MQHIVRRQGVLLVLLVALLVPFGGAHAQAPPHAEAYVSADSVKIGERFTIVLTAEHAVDAEAVFPDPEAESAIFGDLRVIRRGPVQERQSADSRRVDSVTYEVATFALDEARVPPLPIRIVAGTDTTRTNTSARTVPVISTVNADAQGLRDPAALASFPQPLWTWIVLALVAMALLMSLVYLWWRQQRGIDLDLPLQLGEMGQTPYEVATSQLRRLDQRELTDPEAVKSFYVDLADSLRIYLAQTLGVAALERTTRELVETLEHRPDVPTKAVGRIQAVLELADLVKFAGERPSPDDHETSLQEARDAVDAVEAASRSRDRTPTEERPSPA